MFWDFHQVYASFFRHKYTLSNRMSPVSNTRITSAENVVELNIRVLTTLQSFRSQFNSVFSQIRLVGLRKNFRSQDVKGSSTIFVAFSPQKAHQTTIMPITFHLVTIVRTRKSQRKPF